MDLAKVYENHGKGLGSYPEPKLKELFGKRGVQFCQESCARAGVTPDKGYPYFNPGGIAVLGDVYCTISHPTNGRKLEIIIGESGPFYRTNGIGGYGPNIEINSVYGTRGFDVTRLSEYSDIQMSKVIRDFMQELIR